MRAAGLDPLPGHALIKARFSWACGMLCSCSRIHSPVILIGTHILVLELWIPQMEPPDRHDEPGK